MKHGVFLWISMFVTTPSWGANLKVPGQFADIQPAIDTALHAFDRSLSTYLDSSIISRVNRNEVVGVDAYFRTVFDKAREVWEYSDHAFDITIAPLINGWGFGFEKAVEMDSAISLGCSTSFQKSTRWKSIWLPAS